MNDYKTKWAKRKRHGQMKEVEICQAFGQSIAPLSQSAAAEGFNKALRSRRTKHHHHHEKGGNQLLKLSFWEEFLITAGISLLTSLENKLTNPAEKAALQAAVDFLQKLLAGTVSVNMHN